VVQIPACTDIVSIDFGTPVRTLWNWTKRRRFALMGFSFWVVALLFQVRAGVIFGFSRDGRFSYLVRDGNEVAFYGILFVQAAFITWIWLKVERHLSRKGPHVVDLRLNNPDGTPRSK
jgi:hypothetical protein